MSIIHFWIISQHQVTVLSSATLELLVYGRQSARKPWVLMLGTKEILASQWRVPLIRNNKRLIYYYKLVAHQDVHVTH